MSTNRERLPRLRILEIALWVLGVVLLGSYFGIRARQRAVAARDVREFQRARQQESQRLPQPAPEPARPQQPEAAARQLAWGEPDQSLWSPERIRAWRAAPHPSSGPALAVLRIPHIHLEVPILEGTDDATLDRGVGHIEGTPGLDAPGNVGLAGHRDGFFRGLKDVGPGDEIDMETRTGIHRYVVKDIVIVKPDDVWVLDDDSARLTLVTCYPFYYTGSAPQRYIVRAWEKPAT
jgi:sortase A